MADPALALGGQPIHRASAVETFRFEQEALAQTSYAEVPALSAGGERDAEGVRREMGNNIAPSSGLAGFSIRPEFDTAIIDSIRSPDQKARRGPEEPRVSRWTAFVDDQYPFSKPPAAPKGIKGEAPKLTREQALLAAAIRENVPPGTRLPPAEPDWLQALLDVTESVTAHAIHDLTGVDSQSAAAIAKAVNDYRGFARPETLHYRHLNLAGFVLFVAMSSPLGVLPLYYLYVDLITLLIQFSPSVTPIIFYTVFYAIGIIFITPYLLAVHEIIWPRKREEVQQTTNVFLNLLKQEWRSDVLLRNVKDIRGAKPAAVFNVSQGGKDYADRTLLYMPWMGLSHFPVRTPLDYFRIHVLRYIFERRAMGFYFDDIVDHLGLGELSQNRHLISRFEFWNFFSNYESLKRARRYFLVVPYAFWQNFIVNTVLMSILFITNSIFNWLQTRTAWALLTNLFIKQTPSPPTVPADQGQGGPSRGSGPASLSIRQDLDTANLDSMRSPDQKARRGPEEPRVSRWTAFVDDQNPFSKPPAAPPAQIPSTKESLHFYFYSPRDRLQASMLEHGVSVRGAWLLPNVLLQILERVVRLMAEKNDLHGTVYLTGPFSFLWYKITNPRQAVPKNKRIVLSPMPYAPAFAWTTAQKSGTQVMEGRHHLLDGSWIPFRELPRGRKVFIISFVAAALISATATTWTVIGGFIHGSLSLIVTLAAMGIGIVSSYRKGGLMQAILKNGKVLDTRQPWSLVTLLSMMSPGKEAADSVASAVFYQKRLAWAGSQNPALARKNGNLAQDVLGSSEERDKLSKWINPFRLFVFSTRTWVYLVFLTGIIYAVVGPNSALWMWTVRFLLLQAARQFLTRLWMKPGILAIFTRFYSRFSSRKADILKNLVAWPALFVWEIQRLSMVAVIILMSYAIFAPKDIPHEFQDPVAVGSQFMKEAREEIRDFRFANLLSDLNSLWKDLQLLTQQNLRRTGDAIAPGFNLPRTSESDTLTLPSGAKYAVTPLVAPQDIRHLPSLPAGEPDQIVSAPWPEGYNFYRMSLLGNLEFSKTNNPFDPAFQMNKVDGGSTAKYIPIRPTDPDIVAVILHFDALEAGKVEVEPYFAFEGGAVTPHVTPLELPAGKSDRRVELSPNIEANALNIRVNYAASGFLLTHRPPPRIKVESIDVIRKGKDAVRDRIAPWRPGHTRGRQVEEGPLGFTLRSRKLLKLIVHFNGLHPSLLHFSVRVGSSHVELGTYSLRLLDQKLEIDTRTTDFGRIAESTYLEFDVDSPGQSSINSSIDNVEEIFAPPDAAFAVLPIMGLPAAFNASALKAMAALNLWLHNPAHAWPIYVIFGLLWGILIHQTVWKPSPLATLAAA